MPNPIEHFLIIRNEEGEELKFPLTEEEYQSLKDKIPQECCYACNNKGSIACEDCKEIDRTTE